MKKKASGKTVLNSERIIPCYMADKSTYGKMVLVPTRTRVTGRAFEAELAGHLRNSANYLKLKM